MNLRSRVRSAEAQVVAARDKKIAVAKLRRKRKALLRQVRIQKGIAQPISHTQIIAVLGELLPESVALTNVTMNTTRPPPKKRGTKESSKHANRRRSNKKPVKQAEDQILIALTAVAPDNLTVANLIGILNDHPLFHGVRMRYSRAEAF